MATAPPVYLPKTLRVTQEQFLELVKANPELRFEQTATGELTVMPPTGGETGRQNAQLILRLGIWNEAAQLGEIFDASTGFRLPNGAIRSPDVAWVAKDRWRSLTPAERCGFAPLCPDFVIELASPSDSLETLSAKMQEYIENGCRLGWLIAPELRFVEIYRPNRPAQRYALPLELSGEDVLLNFTLKID